MGLINKLWSGADFWDKKENAQQRQQFQKDDEERKRREAEARAKAQAAKQPKQQTTTTSGPSTLDLPFKPPTINTNPLVNPNKPVTPAPQQVYKPVTPTVTVEGPTAEQKAHDAKINELKQLTDKHRAQALAEEKSRTSRFDRQFTDRGWDKRAEAIAISRATREYQDKNGWNADSDVVNYQRGASSKVDEAQNTNASKWIAPVLSTARVGTGIVQGAAGLYDLATPGKGTNRISQGATKKAEEQDQLAKDFGVDGVYKAGNIAGEILSYAIPGMIAAKGAKAAQAGLLKGAETASGFNARNALRAGQVVSNKVDDIAKMIDNGGDANKIRQFIAARVKQNFTVEEAIQELMITGRYMGQNTAQGGDTSWQSMGLDAATGLAGGLIVPAKGVKQMFNSGDEAGVAFNDAAGAAIDTGVAAARRNMGLPPEAPMKPHAPEVAPGVNAPNLVTANPQPGRRPPFRPPETTTPQTPTSTTPQTPTPVTQPPVQQQPPVESTAPVVQPPIYKQVEPPQKPVVMDQPPEPVQVVPETAPVTTPIKEASQEVVENSAPVVVPQQAPTPAPNPANTSDEALNGLRNQRESLIAERDAMAADGMPTLDLDRRIAQLDKNIAAKVAKPSKEATVLAEGDQQLADARVTTKPEISKQEAPKKPKKDEGVTTRQMSEEEMRAKGMSDEAIANIMANRPKEAPVKAPKVKKTEKTNVAQSETTPVKTENGWTKEGVDEIRREGEAAGATKKQIADEVALYKKENPQPKTVAEPKAVETPVVQEAPKAPTQRQLNKAVTDAPTTKAGKVTAAWKNEQKANGATDEQIAKAVEKVEGRKVAPTETEEQLKAKRELINQKARDQKKLDEEKGLTDKAASKLTKELSKQTSRELENKEIADSLERLFTARTTKVDLAHELNVAGDKVDAVSDSGMVKFAEDSLADAEDFDDPRHLILGAKISRRLERMNDEGTLSDNDFLDLVGRIERGKALKASLSGQTQRVVRELYLHVPAAIRVQRQLDKMDERLQGINSDKKLNYTDADRAELIAQTKAFDAEVTKVNGLETELASGKSKLLDTSTDLTDQQLDELSAKFDADQKAYEEALGTALKASQAYGAKLNELNPPLSRADKVKGWALAGPDVAGNYLRMSMLSAPSGRVRDGMSTITNVFDQLGWSTIATGTGKALNKVTGKNTYEDSFGSMSALKKGFFGGFKKLKSSYTGEATLDEALGKTPKTDRSELAAKDSISSFGSHKPDKPSGLLHKALRAPKGFIRASVQASTDLSYGVYTKKLHDIGLQKAKAAGLEGKRADMFAKLYMEQPEPDDIKKAASKWLENSGMHENFVTDGLKYVTDKLDEAGTHSKYPKGHSKEGQVIPYANRLATKTLARTIRTTTIPFVQYMGGAMHGMAIQQNPLANVSKAVIAMAKKDPQAAVENLARGGWNTAKIGTLVALMNGGAIEVSDTDADGESNYNSPYVKVGDRYIPASTFGIAGGGALIAAHYVRKAKDAWDAGDYTESLTASTFGPLWAVVKASGLDNTISGENIFGGVPAKVGQTLTNSDKDSSDGAGTLFGGILGDLGTQASPSVLRDIDSVLNQQKWYNPTGEAPDTSGKDPVTGKVDPIQKGLAQIKSGIPGLSNDLPRKSGVAAKDWPGRVLNANSQTDQQKAAITADTEEKTTTVNRTADVVSDDKVANLLSEETRTIYDKYNGDMSKASKEDSKKIWTEVKAAKDRLIDDGQYGSYKKILTYERDEAKAKGSSTETEIKKMDRNITRAEIADKHKVNAEIYRLYTGTDKDQGGGISQDEFAKMIKEDDPAFDMDTANKLWDLDKWFTEAGVSANANGLDPWKKQKYSMPKPKKGGSGGSGGEKGVGTGFGNLGTYAETPLAQQGQKYQKLTSSGGAMPNLTAQSSKTNLKKNISVVKGVRL